MMSDFDYSLDVDAENQDGFEQDEFEWDNVRPAPGPMFNSRRYNMNPQRYSEAFGDYRGGYGPGGGFGAPRPRPYPPGPPGPPRGRGFGPIGPPRRGPPMHRAALFLADCEVAPQYIKALPWQLLDMIEPGYCGLCSQNLESFAVAQIHYNCKNHYKAQKKFIALHKPTKNKSEMPMKARNLYCELCDVQITSTAHADSHYAGKSHRAIVEGRKPPKNPVLLQQAMGGRTEQLIRREKKHLKNNPEPVKTEEVKASADKNIPPELICEICKTSVTCSEQMTNHLNGKKHLTKEKQHILKMMKGGANDKNKANSNAEDANEEENIAEAEEGTEEPETVAENDHGAGVDDNNCGVDDWTSGGGAEWDSHNPAQSTTEG